MDFLAELWRFMRVRKKFWLLPILIMMVVFGGLVVLTKGSRVRAVHLHAVLKVMRILGISAFYHDSAAALVEDGRIVAAAQEERFTRKKHDASFPHNAIGYCLEAAGAKLSDIDHVAFYDKPFLKFERLLETYIALAPRGFRSFQMAIPLWLKEKLFQKSLLRKKLKEFDEEIRRRQAACSPSII